MSGTHAFSCSLNTTFVCGNVPTVLCGNKVDVKVRRSHQYECMSLRTPLDDCSVSFHHKKQLALPFASHR